MVVDYDSLAAVKTLSKRVANYSNRLTVHIFITSSLMELSKSPIHAIGSASDKAKSDINWSYIAYT